jgi:hypothetical protein
LYGIGVLGERVFDPLDAGAPDNRRVGADLG